MPHTGNYKYWSGYAQNKASWSRMIQTLDVNTYKRYQENTSTSPNEPSPNPPSPPKGKRNANQSNNSNHIQNTNVKSRASALRTLQLHTKATRREVVLQYRHLARTYHSDKWNENKPFSRDDSAEMFKLIANARDFLLQ